MINGIGPTGPGRVDGIRTGASQPAKVGGVGGLRTAGEAAPASPASELAAAGPPVDLDKVAAIRAQIANGSYVIDPKAIAEKMMTLDLPPKA